MVEAGFVKADSRNLPKIDVFMVAEFIKTDDRFNVAEIRLVKASLSSRDNYGAKAIGYVSLKREGSTYFIKGKITPEHRVRSKNYTVKVIVDSESEKVQDVSCEDCAAALGVCKHSLAFLIWLHRKSEERSPTEVECYWRKPILGSVGSTMKFLKVEEMCKKSTVEDKENVPDNIEFFNAILKKAEEKQMDCQLSRHNFVIEQREPYALSLHEIFLEFIESGKTSADDFMQYAASKYTMEMCQKIQKKTEEQCDSVLWHEMRYGRITASVVHEAAHCEKGDGSLIQRLLGASKKFDSLCMKRGRNLESCVLSKVEKKIQLKLNRSGFILMPDYPMFGASPDAIGPDFICEVKCPASMKNVNSYIKNGNVCTKFKAQMHLQMLAANKKKGLFCIADPLFENNKSVDLIWIKYDSEYMNLLLEKATHFWKEFVFTKIKDSILKKFRRLMFLK